MLWVVANVCRVGWVWASRIGSWMNEARTLHMNGWVIHTWMNELRTLHMNEWVSYHNYIDECERYKSVVTAVYTSHQGHFGMFVVAFLMFTHVASVRFFEAWDEIVHIWHNQRSNQKFKNVSSASMFPFLPRSGKFSSNLSPSGRIWQVQNTTSCHNSGTMHLNSIRVFTVRGHARYKYPSRNTMPKSPGTNSNTLRISWSDTSFSPTIYQFRRQFIFRKRLKQSYYIPRCGDQSNWCLDHS